MNKIVMNEYSNYEGHECCLIFFDLVITLYSHVCHPRSSGCKAKNVHYRPNYLIMSCYLQNSRSSMSFSIIQNIRCMPFVVIISNRKLICELVHGKACSQEHTTTKTRCYDKIRHRAKEYRLHPRLNSEYNWENLL